MMKNKKMVKGIALGAMIAALAAGGTAAYLTDLKQLPTVLQWVK